MKSADMTRDIVVIGGSMGAIEGLKSLLAELPPDLPAAFFAVIHTAASSSGDLGAVLSRRSRLPVRSARTGDVWQPGTLTVAPPDHHLLIRNDTVLLSRGPRENRTRPAIDPLFRSAAVCCTTRVIGVILSGYLDDGAAGLAAIKRCGGLTVVLEPSSTPYSAMPQSALRAVDADHCLPLGGIGELLPRLIGRPAPPPPEVPEELKLESRMMERSMVGFGRKKAPGKSTALSCPECGGPLWQMDEEEKIVRFRCTVGHAYSEENLLASQSEAAEQALWVALRTLDERARFLRGLAEKARLRDQSCENWDAKAAETEQHVAAIRKVLLGSDPTSFES
ncbi:MAG: chemotaxis protein CheB [Syntrophotaleaceae bacterium]